VRAGNWLSLKQAQALLNAPDITTTKGLRDRAIIAVLLGCALRRSEVAALTMGHIQQRDGRWCIVDLYGKHGRVRTYDPTGSVWSDPNPSPTCDGRIGGNSRHASACWNRGTTGPGRAFDWRGIRPVVRGAVSEWRAGPGFIGLRWQLSNHKR
jgi:hypothetical protein